MVGETHFFHVGYDFHQSTEVDDFGYIHALISYLQESLQLSQSNVFAMGMSNGGDMSYMLACQSDVIRAIAPVAGCMMKTPAIIVNLHVPFPFLKFMAP